MREFKFRIFDLEDNKMYQNRDFEGIDFVDKYARLENGFIDFSKSASGRLFYWKNRIGICRKRLSFLV